MPSGDPPLSQSSARAAAVARWQCSLAPFADLGQLEQSWRTLEAEAQPPFFLSWEWIGCWLKAIPRDQWPRLLRIERGDQLVGLGLLSTVRQSWLGMIPRRGLYLHETGNPDLDSLTIEHNGVLTLPAFRDEATRQAAEWLLSSSQTDELHLPGISASTLHACDHDRISIRLRDSKPAYTVDLARIVADGKDFVMTLSGNTRTQLRRAMRQYQALGDLRISEAATIDAAQDMLTAMIPLHQTYWQRRGRDGAFANPAFLSFHRRLIQDSFATGSIQFLRCEAGSSVIGYLYNFRKDRHIYSYQSGFDYDLLPRSKPGWVCHYLAIEDNLRRGMAIYDLLAGHSQFKRSFAQPTETLVWAVVERNGWLPAIDRSLRRLKHWITAGIGARTHANSEQ